MVMGGGYSWCVLQSLRIVLILGPGSPNSYDVYTDWFAVCDVDHERSSGHKDFGTGFAVGME